MKKQIATALDVAFAGRVALAALLVMLALSAGTLAQDSPENRRAAALRYAEVFDIPKLMNDTVRQMAAAYPPDKRALFVEFMRGVDMQRLKDVAITAMA